MSGDDIPGITGLGPITLWHLRQSGDALTQAERCERQGKPQRAEFWKSIYRQKLLDAKGAKK
jgi:hypothetical protein